MLNYNNDCNFILKLATEELQLGNYKIVNLLLNIITEHSTRARV